MNVHVRYARVVTNTFTYVKHTFEADDIRAVVRDPRNMDEMNVIVLGQVETRGPGLYRIEGTDDDGHLVVWSVDDIGCGCRSTVRVLDTDPTDIPT